jgi:hypothetical protein
MMGRNHPDPRVALVEQVLGGPAGPGRLVPVKRVEVVPLAAHEDRRAAQTAQLFANLIFDRKASGEQPVHGPSL